MIELFAAAFLLLEPTSPAPENQQATIATAETRVRLPIPDAINAEVMPYVNCVVAQANLQQSDMSGITEETYPQLRLSILSACAKERVSAKDAAVKALHGVDVRRAERPEYVERVLRSAEDNLLVSPWANASDKQTQ